MVQRDEVTPETWAIVGGRPGNEPGMPLNTPIGPASTYLLGGDRIYSRNESTPGWEAFEDVVGGLERGTAVAFASGMAACAAVLNQLPAGAHIVLGDDCYQGVAGLADAGTRERGWRVERLHATDTATWIARALEADMLWLESPSNPLLDVADIASICAAPRQPGTRIVVDNTFATPLNQQPLALGADVVVHSATKLLGGHSDLLLGVAVATDPGEVAALRTKRSLDGATPGALEAYLALRGTRTLPLRLRAMTENATMLAANLAAHPAVEETRYPGFGTIVSFDTGSREAAEHLCASVRIIRHATSLGSVETTLERRNAHPGQEHIAPGLIRMSVGCETGSDLWADLQRALRS